MELTEVFKITSNTTNPTQGQILLAEPLLNSSHFSRSAILLVSHTSDEGSLGVVINKPIAVDINQIIDDFPMFDCPLFDGGPVDEEMLFCMHTFDDVPDAMMIMSGLYWCGDFEYIKSLVISGRATPDNLRFFVGYSGWSNGQLQQELENNTWAVADASIATIMRADSENLWRDLAIGLGGKYRYWPLFPRNPKMN